METAPEKISRYEIKGLIARGGMGRIYLARDPQNGRLVVLKLLDATLDSSDIRQRFEREAQSLAALSHPNVVQIYDNGTFHDSPFIVMEYVRGETLEEKIKRQAPLTLVQKLKLLSELCTGLAHAHQAGIVHRDIKPANLMVDQDDRLKILDFGIARVADSNLTRTRSGGQWVPLQIGTPGYMSPEQIEGAAIDHRTDVFAVGAVAYELFAYREAFPGESTREIEEKVRQTPPPSISSRISSFDPAIDAILAQALARDRQQRFPDAAALGQAFDAYRSRLNAGPLTTRRPALPVDLPRASRAETAYAWAVLAYEEKAFELARRYAIEALAEDPNHVAARTFVAGFQPAPVPVAVPRPGRGAVPPTGSRAAAAPPAARAAAVPPARRPEPGPEVVTTDPTVLISRADRAAFNPSQSQPPAHRPPAPPYTVEPTVVIQREELAKHSLQTDETVVISPSMRRNEQDTEAVAAPPRSRRERERDRRPGAPAAAPIAASIAAFFARLKPGTPAAPPPRRGAPGRSAPAAASGSWAANPATRGVLIGVLAFLVAAVAVLGAISVVRSFWTAGEQLTLTRPIGGTIVADGIECGSQGNDCTASYSAGTQVTLTAQPDKGYLFGGYTGDCTLPPGRVMMDGPHTCGATFNPVTAPDAPATQVLTVDKPRGGTVYAAENVSCGTLGDQCTADVSDGRQVTLYATADTGFRHTGWTGDCDQYGNTVMSGPRRCGAVFADAPGVNVGTPSTRPTGETASTRTAATRAPDSVAAANTAPPPPPAANPAPPPAAAAPSAPPQAPLPTVPAGDTAPAITEKEHATREITTLVKTYCQTLQTLEPERVQKLFATNQLRLLREQYRQYKSLRCVLGADPPKFDDLSFGQSGSGTARVTFSMKQVIQAKSGGAPKETETDVAMLLSRGVQRTEWLIVSVDHVLKPKP